MGIRNPPGTFGYFRSRRKYQRTVLPSRTTVRPLSINGGTHSLYCRSGVLHPRAPACLLTDQKAPKVAGGLPRKGGKPPDPCPPKRPSRVVPLADTAVTVVVVHISEQKEKGSFLLQLVVTWPLLQGSFYVILYSEPLCVNKIRIFGRAPL